MTKLSDKLLNAIQGANELWRTFNHQGNATRDYQLGFRMGVSALAERFKNLRHAVEAFERTDTVRMADENEMFDALQWNLAQYRQMMAILNCEGQATYIESCIVKALERVLRGEKMEKVTV
jgi:hypothetical protein